MTNCKKTKKALFGSVIALILCMSMLVGTTFAWFTDSVVSGNNHIVAGNLDIELEYLVDGAWVTVDASTNVFGESLWEPGHTEVVTLRVSNVGTLALKYQMGINVVNEKTSVNVNGDELKLSDYIEFGIVNGQYTDRAAARAAVANATKLSAGYNEDQVSLLPGESKEITMVVYMPETVGNEANYMTGKNAPEINLGINLMATQLVHENDSFGNDYDEDAKFAALPGATFRKLSVMPEVTTMGGQTVTLDTAYVFETTQTADQAAQNEYGKYHADFVVSFNNPVAKDSIILGGQYDTWSPEWVAFELPIDVAAGEAYRLLHNDMVELNINYEELCSLVKLFKCGAKNLSPANAGTTMTVELRLYEVKDPSETTNNTWNEETGEYVVAGVYTHTFGVDSNAPGVTVNSVDAKGIDVLVYGEGTTTMSLNTAYVFEAEDTVASVQESPYKDWIADYYVSLDQVTKDGLFLVGNYGTYGWIGYRAPVGETYNNFGLLEFATVGPNNWTYKDIVENVGTFTCGVYDEGNHAGAILTVELRLTNPTNPAESIVVSHIEFTL